MAKKTPQTPTPPDQAAGNGLLHRRALLGRGVAFAGAMSAAGAANSTAAAAEPLQNDPWSLKNGDFVGPYQTPSRFEANVKRLLSNPNNEPRTSHARTPLHLLNGTITPNGVHFAISRMGSPDIDPAKHRLLIHGRVKRPLVFTLETLMRYPMETRPAFIECGGNSGTLFAKEPLDIDAGALHGLVSNAEWTGVKLSILLEEAGVDPKAIWALAEGADGATMNRSIPVEKLMDDAMVALFQNGERVNPSQGYPMRLLLPGYEGNMNVKWLRRIKIVDGPVMATNESREYTILKDDGTAWRFFYPMEVKSIITFPSPTLDLKGKGFYEISGLAWSGQGKIKRVEVSADGGKSWADAALQAPILSKAFTRFRLPWNWTGAPAILMSRATDEKGETQPTREAFIKSRATPRSTPPGFNAFPMTHMNAISGWGVNEKGVVKNVFV